MKGSVLHTLHAADNVAVALADLAAGAELDSPTGRLVLLDAILFGHKVALADIPLGSPVVKYGEQIGLASCEIRRGQHVHVHNVASTRGRGDLPAPDASTPHEGP